MAKDKLFEFAVIYHPKQTKEQNDRGETAKSVLVTPPTTQLAGSDDEVSIIATTTGTWNAAVNTPKITYSTGGTAGTKSYSAASL